MSKVARPQIPKKKSRLGLIAFILLALSLYIFWILPDQMGKRQVKVDFEAAQGRK